MIEADFTRKQDKQLSQNRSGQTKSQKYSHCQYVSPCRHPFIFTNGNEHEGDLSSIQFITLMQNPFSKGMFFIETRVFDMFCNNRCFVDMKDSD